MRPIIWKLIISLSFVLCFVWYGKEHFYRDPGSVFYDRENAFEERYSQHRKGEVNEFVQSRLTANPDQYSKSGPRPALCAAFSSVQRRSTQYLETALGSLVHGLTPHEREDLYLAVLIAETNASTHSSWDKQWVHDLADDVFTYNVSTKEHAYLNRLQQTSEYSEKGVYDYIYALRRCFEAGTPYVAMLEDDIILADGWLVRTLSSLKQIASSAEGPWLYMRLFNQERSIGWANQYVGGNNEHWIIFGIGLALSSSALFARKRWRTARTWIDIETLCIVVLVLNPALVILFFQSGKASLLPPSPGVFEEPFGCCSQAMVFPREKVPMLVSFLESKQKGQVDLLLNDLAEEEELGRYAMYPVQAQHIGLESARKTLKTEAQAIWSMAFEDLDASALRKEHLQMAQNYYSH
ncbi:hypothetical protein P170DRAFT_513078 [Aspergillus steynii IBT 23096]|uniref:Integral membrane protein n=1 Tax=Aspergillus steynii IBT 23096 TaxID=1392250 RepID=A0A2I2FWG0_9EURO|nr:uncharacterized protein P170DRAFT_513078 [Aspergillus steynii IBT 23096]PLB44983.1 hypothetical protein P170DRAFT_513078 [Aspergillus steynii IBT 23096]